MNTNYATEIFSISLTLFSVIIKEAFEAVTSRNLEKMNFLKSWNHPDELYALARFKLRGYVAKLDDEEVGKQNLY